MGNQFIATALINEQTREPESPAKSRRRAHDDVIAHLQAVRMFSACGRKELRAVAKAAKVSEVKQGTQLITEGDDGNTMYVVLVGTARVSRGGRKLSTVGPGDTFGELALLSKGPRTASVVALSDMEVAIISRRQLNKLLEAAPAFARSLLESLADVVRQLDKKLV